MCKSASVQRLKTIIINVTGGVACLQGRLPKGLRLEIRDYDFGLCEPSARKDEDGDFYTAQVYEHNDNCHWEVNL